MIISRRELIERYLDYDSRKKGNKSPDTAHWDWGNSDEIELRLREAGFKGDCLVGFRDWELVHFNQGLLARCSVVISISKELGTGKRTLGELASVEGFDEWRPDRSTEWYEGIGKEGRIPDAESILIARPAVPCESPADYYFVDGSGRAMATFGQLLRTGDTSSSIPVYVGRNPDSSSRFMRKHYSALL